MGVTEAFNIRGLHHLTSLKAGGQNGAASTAIGHWEGWEKKGGLKREGTDH